MRNKILWVVIFMLGILVGLGATSVFAKGPVSTAAASGNATWQQMQQACTNGDFQTMQQLHNGVCGGAGATGATTGGTTGWRGMMGGWWNNNNTQSGVPGTSGITGKGWRGMMGGRGGMMGTW